MKLYLSRISDVGVFYLEKKYMPPPKPMNIEQIKEAKDHNTVMIDIASSLNYSEFDEVKNCPSAFDMWEKLKKVFGGEKNVQSSKAKILRGKFDQLKMKGGENITQSSERVKDRVSAIKIARGKIDDETIIKKVLRNLPKRY